MNAWKEGRLSDDITAEQRKVEEAELIIFQVTEITPLLLLVIPECDTLDRMLHNSDLA